MEKINSNERAKEIIKAFKQLSVEEMEKLLIKLGIPTDRKLEEKNNGKIRKENAKCQKKYQKNTGA